MSDPIAERLRVVEADWRELHRQNELLMELHRSFERRLAEAGSALRAVLLFHSGGVWDDEAMGRWLTLSGDREATTRGLCDCVRAALGEGPWASGRT